MSVDGGGYIQGYPGQEFYTICAPVVIVRASGEMQINVTWVISQEPGTPDFSWPNTIILPAYNGSVLYLEDNLGNRVSPVALEGAPRDGARLVQRARLPSLVAPTSCDRP